MSHIEGVDSLIRKLNRLGGNSTVVLTNSIRKATNLVQRDAKLNVPVDSGNLRRSIQARTSTSPQGIQGEVFTNCEYAAYVEYGTRNAAAQPYLYPALNQNNQEIDAMIKQDLRNAIQRAGG